MMKTMQQEFSDYLAQCFPLGVGEEQRRELHRAFFAGALVLEGKMTEISALPHGPAERALNTVYSEIERTMQATADTCRARN